MTIYTDRDGYATSWGREADERWNAIRDELLLNRQRGTDMDLVTIVITEDGKMTLAPGPAFDDEHVPLLVALNAAVGPVLNEWQATKAP